MDNMDHQAIDPFDPHALESAALYLPKPKDSLDKIKEVEDEERGDEKGVRRESNEEEEHSRNSNQMQMSAEEARIRQELEVEIESDLEGEIKDEIYRLALRLHRLYRHQNRNHSEININIGINMEGATKVEINDIKNKKKPLNSEHGNSRRRIHTENNYHHNSSSGSYGNGKTKKFDWTKSLRSGPPKLCKRSVVHNINKHKCKQPNGKEHPATASEQSTGSHKRAESRVLQLTWK